MPLVSTIFRILIGAAAGLGSFLLLIPGFSGLFMGEQPALVLGCGLLMVGLGGVIGALSASIRRTFGWACLSLALCTLSLPLTTMLLSGRLVAERASEAAGDAATLVGAGLGAGLITGAAAIIGLFFGAMLLVAALVLLLGGRREVLLVDRGTGATARGTTVYSALRAGELRRVEPPFS